MLKKVFSLFLVLLLAVTSIGCGAKITATPADSSASSQEESSSSSSSAPAAEESAAPAENAESDTFRLGLYFQLTGNNAMAGTQARDGVLLAIDEINADGGLNGKLIETVEYDTQGSAEESVKVVSKMIANDNIDACIGSINSGDCLAACPYLNEAGIYNMGLGTAASWMLEDWPYVFRPTMNNNATSPFIADMMEQLGYSNYAIFTGQDEAAIGTADNFVEVCNGRGFTCLVRESADQADTDYTAQVAKIVASNPDCVYISCMGFMTPLIIKQLRQAGYTGFLFQKEAVTPDNISIAGVENCNYIGVPTPYVTYNSIEECDIPIVKSFLEKWVAKYGELPVSECAYRGYDAAMVLQEAARIAGSNESDALRDATHTIKMDGLGGTLDFTSGDREGYLNSLNSFILVDNRYQLFTDWYSNNGYEAYKTATGNAK